MSTKTELDKNCWVAKMKYDYKRLLYESEISSRWEEVADTNLGHISIKNFKARMYGPNPTQREIMMVKNDITQAARFPPTI